jgi:hypothetical protein
VPGSNLAFISWRLALVADFHRDFLVSFDGTSLFLMGEEPDQGEF